MTIVADEITSQLVSGVLGENVTSSADSPSRLSVGKWASGMGGGQKNKLHVQNLGETVRSTEF